MQIDWWTFALQGINFLVLVWLLKRFLYHPVREIVDRRKALAADALAQAKEQQSRADKALKRFEADRAALEKEREEMRIAMHHTLEAEREKIKAEAEDLAAKTIAKARQSIADERAEAAKELRQAAVGLAADMAGKILASGGPAALDALALAHIEAKLEDMDSDTRGQLEAHLKEGGTIGVVTAHALGQAAEKAWQKMLAAKLLLEKPADFTVDKALIGGAELRFPHITLGFTVSGQLEAMKQELLHDDHADG